MTKSYAEVYAACCTMTIEEVQKRLGRDLTSQERRSIWNCGSLMMFEAVERGLMAAQSPTDLEQALRSVVEWTEKRFQDSLTVLLKRLPEWLGRTATDAESAALARCEHLGVFMSLTEQLIQAPPNRREAIFHEATAPLMS